MENLIKNLMLINVDEFEAQAASCLDKPIFDYLASGACDEITVKNNREAFNQFALIPRVLRNTSKIDTRTQLLGLDLSQPLMIAPSAFHTLVCEEGELATVRAANQLNLTMVASTMSGFTLEEIALTASTSLWFQLYVYENREITHRLIKRVENAGYQALVITIDVPIMGKRERDMRNQFKLPSHVSAKNFIAEEDIPTVLSVKQYTDQLFDKNFTWDDLNWIRSITSLPIILKGINHKADAKLALEMGVAGIIVSNHGGRQLDTMPASISILPAIVDTLAGQLPILIDGGFRRGTDIFKALALGADAVLLGRPVLWALAINGMQGVIDLFELLKKELIDTMILCGYTTIEEIKSKGSSSLYA